MAEASAESKSTGAPPSPGGRSPRIGSIDDKNDNDDPASGSSAELVGTSGGESTIAGLPSPSFGSGAATTTTTATMTTTTMTTMTTTTTTMTTTTSVSGVCVGAGGPTTGGITGANSKIIGNGSPRSPKHQRRLRIRLAERQLESATREELAAKWRDQDSYVECLEAQLAAQEGEMARLRDSEEKYRQQCCDVSHRERILVRRLASKEQQLLGYVNQITEMRASSTPSASALRSALLDPAVNILVQKLRQELLSTKAKLEDTQNELSAWKFTPDSNTGKRLMAKCRLLYQENEELGRMIASGRIAKLEGELALQKSFSEEVKKSQSELDEFLQDLDEDVEGMQSTIYFLQQELRKARESVSLLQQENNTFKSISVSSGSGLTASQSLDNNLSNGLSTMHTVTIKKEETTNESDSRVSEDTKGDVDPSEVPSQILPSLPSAQPARSFDDMESEFADRRSRRPNEPDESSNDSAALIIKVENEELSDRDDDGDDDDEDNNDNDDDDDDGDDDDDDDDDDEEEETSVDTCENRGPRRQSMRTKERIATTTKNKSVIVGKSNGDEKTSARTSSRRLVRDRTAKRDKSAADSDDERRRHKKKRRESILSLDYNEDDALLLTNGESIQSDPEDGP